MVGIIHSASQCASIKIKKVRITVARHFSLESCSGFWDNRWDCIADLKLMLWGAATLKLTDYYTSNPVFLAKRYLSISSLWLFFYHCHIRHFSLSSLTFLGGPGSSCTRFPFWFSCFFFLNGSVNPSVYARVQLASFNVSKRHCGLDQSIFEEWL